MISNTYSYSPNTQPSSTDRDQLLMQLEQDIPNIDDTTPAADVKVLMTVMLYLLKYSMPIF